MALMNVPTANNLSYTLNSAYTTGGNSLVLNQTVTGVVQAPGVCVVDRIDTNGNKTPTKRTYYKFTGVSSATLTGVTTADGTDQNHNIGAVVEFVPDVTTIGSYYSALGNLVVPSTGALDTTKVVDLTTAQTFTGAKTFTTGLLKAVDVTSGAGVSTFPTSTGTLRQLASRVLSATTYTTNTGTSLNCDTQDMFIVTAQAGDLKFNNPGGTPTDGQKLIITVASSTTAARALTWDTAYGATTVALPSTTANTTVTLSIGFIWSASKSLWQCLAVA